jgi:cytochrome c-type biogenesis protein CcmH/NrfF
MIIIFLEYGTDRLTNQLFGNTWESARRILRENTGGLRLSATKLILVPQNKQQPHQVRQMAQMNCTQCDAKSLWLSHIAVAVVFRKFSKSPHDLKSSNVPLSSL